MESEKFCLRWNDFESNISSAFQELRDDKDFFDVTLACDDEQIQSHRVILSACSPFFRNILRRNPHQHPLLYLKGVKFTDLKSVLNFMYHGEVNVAQEELNSFLAVAEDLRVKGLTQNQPGPAKKDSYSTIKSSPVNRSAPKSHEREPIPQPKRPQPTHISSNTSTSVDDDIQELVPVKTEPLAPPPPQPQPIAKEFYSPQPVTQALAPADEQMVEYQDDSYEDYNVYQEEYEGSMGEGHGADGAQGYDKDMLHQLIEKITDGIDKGKYKCGMCGKINGQKIHTQNHIESYHFPGTVEYNCKYCNMTFTGRNKLYFHVYQLHKGQKY